MEEKTFYLTVRGQRVEVTEEVYRAYIRPMRAERKRRYRAVGRYSVCSVEGMLSNGVEVVDESADCERALIEREQRQEEFSALKAALEKLEGRDREIINMVYFEGKSQTEIGAILGVAQQQVSRYLNYALAKLKKVFQKNFK